MTGRRWLIIQRNWKCEIFKGHFLLPPNARVSLHQRARCALTSPGIVNGGLSVRQAPASARIYPLFASLSLLVGCTRGAWRHKRLLCMSVWVCVCVWVWVWECDWIEVAGYSTSFISFSRFLLLLYIFFFGGEVASWQLSCSILQLILQLVVWCLGYTAGEPGWFRGRFRPPDDWTKVFWFQAGLKSDYPVV